MTLVGFVVHTGRPQAVDSAASLVEWLRARGVTTRSLSDEAVGADEKADTEAFAEGVNLVVSVGGDGTLLRAADLARRADAALLGVNVGRLGFLTAVEPAAAPALLALALEGRAPVEERMAIEAIPEGCPWERRLWALNEVMAEKRARHRLVTMAVFVDGEYLTTLSGDAVIVATPTGSTAYSFSARGPIVTPRLDAILLTPVSPHMVFDRSLTLDPDEEVALEVRGEEPGLVSADGRPSVEFPIGARVRIRRSDRRARLVRPVDGPSFYRLLREKFDLPVDHLRGGSGGVARPGEHPDRPPPASEPPKGRAPGREG
ncbi:MAG TPA: NAD(+)/NADH kinase [Actinomycetota bacterium]|nr:NAD(+)/NADH kinase [Actinomycetota bacterium]